MTSQVSGEGMEETASKSEGNVYVHLPQKS